MKNFKLYVFLLTFFNIILTINNKFYFDQFNNSNDSFYELKIKFFKENFEIYNKSKTLYEFKNSVFNSLLEEFKDLNYFIDNKSNLKHKIIDIKEKIKDLSRSITLYNYFGFTYKNIMKVSFYQFLIYYIHYKNMLYVLNRIDDEVYLNVKNTCLFLFHFSYDIEVSQYKLWFNYINFINLKELISDNCYILNSFLKLLLKTNSEIDNIFRKIIFAKTFLELYTDYISSYNIIYNFEEYDFNNFIYKNLNEFTRFLCENESLYDSISNKKLCFKAIFVMLNMVIIYDENQYNEFYNTLKCLLENYCNIKIEFQRRDYNDLYFKFHIIFELHKILQENDDNSDLIEFKQYIAFSFIRMLCLVYKSVIYKNKEFDDFSISSLIFSYYETNNSLIKMFAFLYKKNYINYLKCLEYLYIFSIAKYCDFLLCFEKCCLKFRHHRKIFNFLILSFLDNYLSYGQIRVNSLLNLLSCFNFIFENLNYSVNFKKSFRDFILISNNKLTLIDVLFLNLKKKKYITECEGIAQFELYTHIFILKDKNLTDFIGKSNLLNDIVIYKTSYSINEYSLSIFYEYYFFFEIEFVFFLNFFIKNYQIFLDNRYFEIFNLYISLIFYKYNEIYSENIFEHKYFSIKRKNEIIDESENLFNIVNIIYKILNNRHSFYIKNILFLYLNKYTLKNFNCEYYFYQ